MRSQTLQRLFDEEGKGLFGCIVSIVLLCGMAFLAITLGPIYYSNYTFESEVKTEASRAGARGLDNQTVVQDVMELAKRNEIPIKRSNIKVDRSSGKIYIKVDYVVPIDLLVVERDLEFEVKASSLVGAL